MGIVLPKYDYFFKYLMTNEKIVKHFLSAVLDIPLEKIKSVRLANTFLWKRFYRQKQGILDVLLILNDDRKINIELQIKIIKYWDRRCLFYLSKMFTEDLLVGEKYSRLKKCVNISILDFSLNELDPSVQRRNRGGFEHAQDRERRDSGSRQRSQTREPQQKIKDVVRSAYEGNTGQECP